MKKQLTSYFTFSKKELNGILILLLLIILILAFPFCYRFFVDDTETYDTGRFRREIALFKASAVERKADYAVLRERIEEEAFKPEYFQFDPNTASPAEWHKLGLSVRQVKVIQNYRAKGGKFFRKEDLRKIYSITDAQYRGLEPYIRIADPNSFRQRKAPDLKDRLTGNERAIITVEINAADSAALDQLRGIGPAFASRIIRFRNRLGGFYVKEQLKEVYGMDSLRYSQLAAQISVDASSIKMISINTAAFEHLKNHPYLTFKQINAIIRYRRQHGNYSSPDDLKKVLILNEEIIRKIGPYLSFDP